MNSSEAIATEYLQNHFKVDNLARALVLETAARNNDATLGTGNNYIFVDTLEGPEVLFDVCDNTTKDKVMKLTLTIVCRL